jgi:hypothetical protein
MSTSDPSPDDFGGFDVDDWDRLKPFTGRAATLADVDAKRAVFALGDTEDARALDMALPQPAIWWDDEADGAGQAAVIVQAEAHRVEGGDIEGDAGDEASQTIEVVGLILADGGFSVALLEDVDLVDPSDPTWRGLVEAAVGDADAED